MDDGDLYARLEAIESMPLETAEALHEQLVDERSRLTNYLVMVEQIVALHDGRSAIGAFFDARKHY